jgi:chromosome segregation and condensation protein ScpB
VKPQAADAGRVIEFALRIASRPLAVVDLAAITGDDTNVVRKHLRRLQRAGVAREVLLPPRASNRYEHTNQVVYVLNPERRAA